MDASGGNNYPVTGIAQRLAQRTHLAADIRCERNDQKHGIGVQLMEQLLQPAADDLLTSLGQQNDFNEAEGTDAYALSAPFNIIYYPILFARKLLGFGKPTDHDMGVEEKPRIQKAGSSSRRSASHSSEVSKLTISPVILIFPAKIPADDLNAGLFAADTVATGRPRLVTVIVP